MNSSAGNAPARTSRGAAALNVAAVFWFATAVIGQFMFAAYMLGHYGRTAANGNISAWNKTLIHGIIEGDPIGNIAVAVHILLAFIITVGGPVQFVPRLRSRFPRFHRWNGRLYVVTAVVISLGGLYMVWTRGVLGGFVNAVAISINAGLIVVCALLSIRHAMAREFEKHRRWTMRLFLAVGGVWFFRIGLMFWVLVNHGPVGVGRNLDGPFAVSWAYGQYLLPLAVYEVYLRAKDQPGAAQRFAMAAALVVLTAATGIGIVVAALGMWLPRL